VTLDRLICTKHSSLFHTGTKQRIGLGDCHSLATMATTLLPHRTCPLARIQIPVHMQCVGVHVFWGVWLWKEPRREEVKWMEIMSCL